MAENKESFCLIQFSCEESKFSLSSVDTSVDELSLFAVVVDLLENVEYGLSLFIVANNHVAFAQVHETGEQCDRVLSLGYLFDVVAR